MPEYGTKTETARVTGQAEMIKIPATYEWVKDDGTGQLEHHSQRFELFKVPPVYETRTGTEVIEKEILQYISHPPKYLSLIHI